VALADAGRRSTGRAKDAGGAEFAVAAGGCAAGAAPARGAEAEAEGDDEAGREEEDGMQRIVPRRLASRAQCPAQ